MLGAIAVSTLSLGLVLVMFGAFRLGNAIRYVPFIGAFLAFIAWLLFRGGITMMSGQPLSFQTIPLLLQPDTLLRWLPGTLLAAGLLALQMVRRHHLNAPLVLVVAGGGFWLVAWLAGAFPAELRSAGYLLTAIAQGAGVVARRSLCSVRRGRLGASVPSAAPGRGRLAGRHDHLAGERQQRRDCESLGHRFQQGTER